MTVDLTGGLDPSDDFVLAEAPSDPEFRQGVNMWIFDDQGRFAIPRLAVEAVGADWERRGVYAHFCLPGGRVLVGAPRRDSDDVAESDVLDFTASAPASGAIDDAGRPTVFGAGPAEFRCVEPFDRWSLSYRGPAVDATIAQQVLGPVRGGTTVDIELHVETTMAVPPFYARAQDVGQAQSQYYGTEGGGLRFEQLFRAAGTLRIGDEMYPFTGSGLRINRRGVRRMEGFPGHTWQTALFPSGRAFRFSVQAPPAGGVIKHNSGYLFDGTSMLPARVVDAPWLMQVVADGEDVACTLESEHGQTRIEGTTFATTFAPAGPGADSRPMQRAGVFFRWDGEEGVGMLERSLPLSVPTASSYG